MKRVVYLTGPPGVGKTTLASLFASNLDAEVISYGALLTATQPVESQAELRLRSSDVISRESVTDIDRLMRQRIDESPRALIVIDSHAVTRERYGFRAIPYDVATLQSLGLTEIVCLIAPPDVISARHAGDRAGRIEGDTYLIDTHTQLQASLALSYSHTSGSSVHFIDARESPEAVLQTARDALRLTV